MTGRGTIPLAVTALLAGHSGMLRAQPVAPDSNFHVAVNGMFRLCPALVEGRPAPDAAALAGMGLTLGTASQPGDARFDGRSDKDVVRVLFEAQTRRCTVHYGGVGFSAVAGVARDVLAKNGLKRLTGGADKGIVTDVFEGPAPSRPAIARFIIIENAATSTAAISYTERAGA